MDRYLTDDEQARLLATLRTAPAHDLLARRDAAALRALLHSGCRLGEFLAVTLGDALDALATHYLFLPREHRKGGKRDHRVFCTDALERDLRELVAVRAELAPGDAHVSDALIVGRHGRPITPRAFQLRFKHWALRAGLPGNVSPHWLRHTRAQNIMQRSEARDPRGVVQRALGHASISSSGIYTATPREQVEAALRSIDATPGRISNSRLRAAWQRRAEGQVAP